ncbi:MAG: hypothetical protein HKO66_10355 [Saprospiraceae bacterium]|nr:hypothetical protein [Bacteroidia bacterium]NNE14581.1 hypothetical protein [Saprospiraceae bacterium]NNL92624.1 hypothetical protein [Saprospiraceae bacterium]
MNNKNKENGKPLTDTKSAKEVLPHDKKELIDKMPDHMKSPLNELEDKDETQAKSE